MTCGDCGKQLVERTVATKTKKVDGDVIVLAQRQALVCDEHGVVAWDPTHPVLTIPYQPWPVTVQPWTVRPGTWYTRYGSGTSGLANDTVGGSVRISDTVTALSSGASRRVELV